MNDTARKAPSSMNLRVRSSVRAGQTKKGDKKDQQDYLVIKLNDVLITSY